MTDHELVVEIRRLHREAMIRAQFSAYLLNSGPLQRFSNYLLAAAGAFTAIVIANLDKMTMLIGAHGLRLTISALIISAAAGFVARYLGLRLETAIAVTSAIEPEIKLEMDRHHLLVEKYISGGGDEREFETGSCAEEASQYFLSRLPFWQHPKSTRNGEISALESLVPLNTAQQVSVLVQAIFAFFVLICVGFFV